MRKVVETESQAIKDTIHSEEDHLQHVESVARAMQNAADKMVSDYNDLVQIIHPNLQNEIQFWWRVIALLLSLQKQV